MAYLVVFWVDGLTYLVSYLAIRGLGGLGPDRAPESEDAKDGAHAVRSDGGAPVGFTAALRIAALHITARFSLAFAALLSGTAGDLMGPIRLGSLGTFQPAQVVLLASGLVVFASAGLVRYPAFARRRA